MKRNVIITLKSTKGSLSGDPLSLKELYDRFRIKHPNAWYLMKNSRGKFDGYVKYISVYGDFQIGLLPSILKHLKEKRIKYTIDDQRLPLKLKPKLIKSCGNFKLRDNQLQALQDFISNRVGGIPFYIGVINAATNFGKCIGKNSLVNTNSGLMRIKDMVNLPYFGETNCYHEIYNHNSQKVTSIKGCNSGIIKAIKITTEKGYTLIGGYKNHRIYTWTQGKFDWVYLRDLRMGQYIPIKHSLPYQGSVSNEFITSEIAYALGTLHGNGHITKYGFGISGIDYEVANHLVKTFKDWDLKIKPHKKFKGFHIEKKGPAVRKLFSYFPELIGSSHTKNIPSNILKAPKYIQSQYIAGLFDTDGSLNKASNNISFSSVNEQVIDELMVMLLNFGVVCKKDKKKTTWQNGKSHTFRIQIQSNYRDIFYREIPMKVKRKVSLKLGYSRTSFDITPMGILEDVSKLFPSRKFKQKVRRGSNIGFNELCNYINGRIVTSKVQSYLNFTQNTFWDTVKSIELIEEECYDLYVPDGNSFIANGFINHNTLLMTAIHESFQRKLKTLVLINNSQIFAQAKKEYPQYLPGEDIGFLQGKNLKFGNFNVGMVQTLSQKVKLIRNELSQIDIVLVDEADVADNKQFRTVLSYLYNTRIRLGLSGSIYMSKLKKDIIHNTNLRCFFGDEIHITTKKDMIKKGYSTPVVIKVVKGNNKNPHLQSNDWLEVFKQAIIKNKVAHELSAERVLYNIKYNRLPAIVVTRFIPHSIALFEYYKKHKHLKKYRIYRLDHNTPKKTKEWALDRFKKGYIDILIVTYIIKRGINLPISVYMQNAAGSNSEEDISQLCGRMERKSEGKNKSYLDDMYYYGPYIERHSKHRINYYIRTGMKVINLIKKKK